MTKALDPSVKKLLEGALKEIRTRGWIQGTFSSDDGVCLLGAIDAVYGHTAEPWETQDAAERAIKRRIARKQHRAIDGVSIADWNDRKGRKEAEVVALLKETIAGG